MIYWDRIKKEMPDFSDEHKRLKKLYKNLETEIDHQQQIIDHIGHKFELRKEPNFLGGALISHFFWHFNHSMMFYVAMKLANLSGAWIILRALFENFISLQFILSDTSQDKKLAEIFFEHSKAEDKKRFNVWYREVKRSNGKKLNLLMLCKDITDFSHKFYKYNAIAKYDKIFTEGSIFTHPSSLRTGQWWKYIENEKRFAIDYSVDIKQFDDAACEAIQIMKIFNEIYYNFFIRHDRDQSDA